MPRTAHRPRLLRHACAAPLGAGMALLFSAAAFGAAAPSPLSVEVESVPSALQTTVATTPQRDAAQRNLSGINGTPRYADDGMRVRWWVGRGAVEVGAGADYAASGTGTSGTPTMGVRAEVYPGTRVVYEVRGQRPWEPGLRDGFDTAPQRHVGLELKAAPSQGSGLLRVQLSSQSMLQLRPRGGGFNVAYRSRF